MIFDEIFVFFEARNEGVKRSHTPIGADSSSAVHKVRESPYLPISSFMS